MCHGDARTGMQRLVGSLASPFSPSSPPPSAAETADFQKAALCVREVCVFVVTLWRLSPLKSTGDWTFIPTRVSEIVSSSERDVLTCGRGNVNEADITKKSVYTKRVCKKKIYIKYNKIYRNMSKLHDEYLKSASWHVRHSVIWKYN